MVQLSGFLTILIATIWSIFGILSFISYHNLTNETSIAELKLTKIGDRIYEVKYNLSGGKDKVGSLVGDDWEIEGNILKPRYVFEALGLSPRYRLDRICSRYESEFEVTKKPQNCIFIDSGDLFYTIKHFASWIISDTSYGSATYLPLVDGASYQVLLTPTGLMARPLNKIGKDAVNSIK